MARRPQERAATCSTRAALESRKGAEVDRRHRVVDGVVEGGLRPLRAAAGGVGLGPGRSGRAGAPVDLDLGPAGRHEPARLRSQHVAARGVPALRRPGLPAPGPARPGTVRGRGRPPDSDRCAPSWSGSATRSVIEPAGARQQQASEQQSRLARRLRELTEKADRGGDVGGLLEPLEIEATTFERDLIVGGARRREAGAKVAQARRLRAELERRETDIRALVERCLATVDPRSALRGAGRRRARPGAEHPGRAGGLPRPAGSGRPGHDDGRAGLLRRAWRDTPNWCTGSRPTGSRPRPPGVAEQPDVARAYAAGHRDSAAPTHADGHRRAAGDAVPDLSANRLPDVGGAFMRCTQPGCTGTIVDGYCDVCGSPGPVEAARRHRPRRPPLRRPLPSASPSTAQGTRPMHPAGLHRHHRRRLLRRLRVTRRRSGAPAGDPRGSRRRPSGRRCRRPVVDDHPGIEPARVHRVRLAAPRRRLDHHPAGELRLRTAPHGPAGRRPHPGATGSGGRRRERDHGRPRGAGEQAQLSRSAARRWVAPATAARAGPRASAPSAATGSPSRRSSSRATSSPTSTRWPAAWPTAVWAGSTWRGTRTSPTAGWCSRGC